MALILAFYAPAMAEASGGETVAAVEGTIPDDIDMPVCSSYTDVNSGENVLLARENTDKLKLCTSNKQFLVEYGIANSSIGEGDKVVWTLYANKWG